MKKPKLVVICAYPATGKSTITKYLAKELNYVRLSGDYEMREEAGEEWFRTATEKQKGAAFARLYEKREKHLGSNENVLIDTTGHSEEMRDEHFDTKVECDKYLVWMKVSPEMSKYIVTKRIAEGTWPADDPDPLESWIEEMGWEDPEPSPDYELIVYENKQIGDLDKIIEQLREKFGSD